MATRIKVSVCLFNEDGTIARESVVTDFTADVPSPELGTAAKGFITGIEAYFGQHPAPEGEEVPDPIFYPMGNA